MPSDQPEEIKVCRNCGLQPISKWRRVKKVNARSGFGWRCVVCLHRSNAKWAGKHRPELRAYNRQWAAQNQDKKNASDMAWKEAHADYRRAYTRKHNRAIRERILLHYGGPNPVCACPSRRCGETTVQFLCLDHIDGGGNHHRAQVGSGTAFYAWIVKNNFPNGYRILCHNCNFALGAFGMCPHSDTDK